MILSRRVVLAGLGAVTLLSGAQSAQAKPAFAKLVIVLLRGAMDSLSALPKLDDPHIHAHRERLIPQGALPLSNGFAAHPALATWHRWFEAGEAAFVHALAGPYRQRSHFKAQDLLETGERSVPGREGWLNRLLQVEPSLSALSIGPAAPLILQGPAAASSWSPPVLPPVSDDTLMRLRDVYESDALLSSALAQAINTSEITNAMGPVKAGRAHALAAIKAQMDGAGRLLANAQGPDIAVIDSDGWDTHSGQMPRLKRLFGGLDAGLSALKAALGPAWAHTAVVIVSEFGRTVRENGGGGSDHGTAGAALLAGGAIRPGQHSDWPGLSPAALYENRDVFPVNDMNALFAGLLSGLYGVSQRDMNRIFASAPKAMRGLV